MIDEQSATSVADWLGQREAAHLLAQVESCRGQVDHLTGQVVDYQQAITRTLRQMAEQRDMLQIAQEAANDRTYVTHLAEEWELLREHPRLAEAVVVDSKLTLVTTDDIRLHREDSCETRWLGAFRIELDLNDGEIRLHNLHTRRGGRDHPHVVNGNPCFGGDHGVFSELMAAGSLHLLYEMLLQYLEKLNLRDEYGAYGAYWFEQEDVRPEGAPMPEVEPEPATPMPITEFAARYGEGARFIAQSGPFGRDSEQRGGEVSEVVTDRAVRVEYDGGEQEERGDGLMVVAA